MSRRDTLPRSYKERFIDPYIKPEQIKELFNENNIVPLGPGRGAMPTTRTVVTSDAVFQAMMTRSGDIEYEGLAVNRLMVDTAFHIAVHGNIERAAQEVGVSPNTIRRAMARNQSFTQLLQRFTAIVIAELGTTMVSVARESVTALREVINDQCVDPAVRVKAAQDILDRVGLKQDHRAVIDVNNNVNYLTHMSDAEIAEFAEIDLREVIDLDCTAESFAEIEDTQAES